MLEQAEIVRREITQSVPRSHKDALGQFLTPSKIAQFMATLFPTSPDADYHLLDAGAGVGALSCAALDVIHNEKKISPTATAVELDELLITHLSTHLENYKKITINIINDDFIEYATKKILSNEDSIFTHAILNPPYKKIHSQSRHRKLLRDVGIEAVNLYAAFIALSLKLLKTNGSLVALVPRSFCSGPYYQKLRELILKESSIKHIHLFNSRTNAFKDYKVQQENVIIVLQKSATPNSVRITTSTDEELRDLTDNTYQFNEIVIPNDDEKFIHIPTPNRNLEDEIYNKIKYTAKDLDLQISTGPVVDFRVKPQLSYGENKNSVPLIHPKNIKGMNTEWPIRNSKKPTHINDVPETQNQLYPMGYYCIIKRFSPKEQQQRILASTVIPSRFKKYKKIGIENHINVFHKSKAGLDKELALGLTAYLNSSIANTLFQQFNSHTQVNAGDLRKLKYPSESVLKSLGKWAAQAKNPSQKEIDDHLTSL